MHKLSIRFALTLFSTALFSTLGSLTLSANASAEELFNLATTEVGMHRISYAQLKAQGADLTGLQARRIGLSVNGKSSMPMALRVFTVTRKYSRCTIWTVRKYAPSVS